MAYDETQYEFGCPPSGTEHTTGQLDEFVDNEAEYVDGFEEEDEDVQYIHELVLNFVNAHEHRMTVENLEFLLLFLLESGDIDSTQFADIYDSCVAKESVI